MSEPCTIEELGTFAHVPRAGDIDPATGKTLWPRGGSRPMILDEHGKNLQPYTRASTLAGAISDKEGLITWTAAMALQGLSRDLDAPHLLAMISEADWAGEKLPYSTVYRALGNSDHKQAAERGTHLHELTQKLDEGRELGKLTKTDNNAMRVYAKATERFEMISIERFTVNDAVLAAGTYDRLVRLPSGKICVADIKTGSNAASPAKMVSTAAQMAIYARGAFYDPATGQRHPLPGVDLTTACLIWLDRDGEFCEIHKVDISAGWQNALVAVEVLERRQAKLAEKLLKITLKDL